MEKNAKIYVAGHRGLVGSALVRCLTNAGFTNLLLRTHAELDLVDQRAVFDFFDAEKPAYVFLAAAKVGGIIANSTYPAEFIYVNLQIQNNVIHAAWKFGVTKLLFLGSSCIFPRLASQPMREDALLTGPLEPTNQAYALAKIAGIITCQSYYSQYSAAFISAMPTNLYGPGDNYHPENSHVLPALIRRFHEAKVNRTPTVTIWGTGAPLREFLYSEDAADACIFLMNTYAGRDFVNIGTGEEVSIAELAQTVKNVIGYQGEVVFDPSKPDGMPRKLLDCGKLHAMGWRHRISMQEGIRRVYADFISGCGS
jgi:GDP-L-fucose synthase